MLKEIVISQLVTFLIPISLAQAGQKGTEKQEDCLEETKDNITWPQTKPGHTAIVSCPNGQLGNATRYCKILRNSMGTAPIKWDRNVNFQECKDEKKIKHAGENGGQSTLLLRSVLLDLNKNTSVVKKSSMTSKKLNSFVLKLEELVDILKQFNRSNEFLKYKENAKTLIDTASNLLDLAYADLWINLQRDEFSNPLHSLVTILDDIGFMVANAFNKSINDPVVVKCKNLAVKTCVIKPGIKGSLYFAHRNSSISLPPELFSSTEPCIEVTIVYSTLSKLLKMPVNDSLGKHSTTINVTSSIVSSTVTPRKNFALKKSFVKIILPNEKQFNKSTIPVCVSWNPKNRETSWTKEGCSLISDETDVDKIACACSHLTLFASFMDPHGIPIAGVHRVVLDIISLIGCSVSLLGVSITFATIFSQWNRLKSLRMEILLNICVAIGSVCLLVIVEQPARKITVLCKLLSVLLHYWLLTAFCWMFNEGLLLYLMVVKVNMTGVAENIRKPLYVFGWGFPLLLLAISLWATELRGYGDPPFICWLSKENSLIWAFVAPVLVVIVVNIFVLAKIVMRIKKPQRLRSNQTPDNIKMAVRATIVTMPLLGVTWLFGLMTFHTDFTFIRYLFATSNSLQGVFIFLFHCLLDRQVRKAVKLSRIKRKQRKKTAPIPDIEVKACVIYQKNELHCISERRKACIDNAIVHL